MVTGNEPAFVQNGGATKGLTIRQLAIKDFMAAMIKDYDFHPSITKEILQDDATILADAAGIFAQAYINQLNK